VSFEALPVHFIGLSAHLTEPEIYQDISISLTNSLGGLKSYQRIEALEFEAALLANLNLEGDNISRLKQVLNVVEASLHLFIVVMAFEAKQITCNTLNGHHGR
jgi:glycine cleavage system regulatory protein